MGSIVEESAGRNREAMLLFMKIMPIFNHYVCTGFRISNTPYGGRQEQLAGTGQGNKFSRDMCRDVSCLIIKEIENRNLGIKFKAPIREEEEKCVSISFVDDTHLITEGDDSEGKMQEIIDAYESLYEATGGKIGGRKTKCCAWKWKLRQGRRVLHQVKIKLKINGQMLEQLKVNESKKMLGICIGPSLKWDKQFEKMREKMIIAMKKLNNTPMTIANACTCYNMHLIKQVYFGCGVLKLTPK